jgi:DNA polymerase-3 subunit delta
MLYFYYGQEEYNIEAALQKIKAEVVDKTFLATNYRVYDNPKFLELIDILRTPALMFGNVFAVINCDKYFFDTKGKISFEDNEIKAIEEAVQSIPESLHIAFVCRIERGSTKKVDSRRKLFKILSKHGSAVEFSEFKSYQKELAAWIQQHVKKKELTMSSDVVQFLIERLGTNLRLIDSEIEKLKLAIYPSTTVKKEDIEEICTATEDIFLLADYILKGQKDLAVKEFQKLCANKHYLEILAVLQTNFTKLAAMKIDSASLSSFEIASKTRIHEFVVKKQLEKIRNVPMDRLVKIRKNLLEAEYRIKTGEMAFYELPLELALLS